MDKIYKFSEKYLDQQKKLTVYLISGFWLTFVIIMLFTVGMNSITFLIIVFNGLLFALITYLSLRFSFTSMRSLEIHLTTDGIQRKNGNKIETFLYKDVKKITIKSTKSGELKSIKINMPKKVLLLVGFEDINGLVAQLKEKISQDVIKQKTMILDWTNPIIMLSSMLIVFIVAYFVLSLIPRFTTFNITKITGVIFLLVGIEYIYLKPSSRMGMYSEKYDIVGGIIFILLGLFDIFK